MKHYIVKYGHDEAPVRVEAKRFVMDSVGNLKFFDTDSPENGAGVEPVALFPAKTWLWVKSAQPKGDEETGSADTVWLVRGTGNAANGEGDPLICLCRTKARAKAEVARLGHGYYFYDSDVLEALDA